MGDTPTHRLLIMRHAKSDWGDPSHPDIERPLNERGHGAAVRMAAWIDEHGLVPERIVSSSAVRTGQTVQHLVQELDLDPGTVVFRDDLYLADAVDWVEAIRDQAEEVGTVLICGHNPGMDDLVRGLSADDVPLGATGKLMTTAAVAHLTFDRPWAEVGPGCGRLVAVARPRELRPPDRDQPRSGPQSRGRSP